ncbi:MAG: hypothetical protein ACNI27_13170 [Desulfovibrio sp.]
MKKIVVSMVLVLASVFMFSSFAQAAWVWGLTPDIVQVRATEVFVRAVTPSGGYRYGTFPKTEKEFLAAILSAQASGAKVILDFDTPTTIVGVGVSTMK